LASYTVLYDVFKWYCLKISMYNNGLPRQTRGIKVVYGVDPPEVWPVADGFILLLRKTSFYLNGQVETSM